MDLTTHIVPGADFVTLHVSGEIDLHTAPSLREAALAALRQHGTNLRVDLSDVTFMDSTGIEVLLATRRRAQLEGGSLTLCRLTPAVRRIIEVTGLDRLFTIVPDESGAPV
jgi:anti-sigma B factor antagonist